MNRYTHIRWAIRRDMSEILEVLENSMTEDEIVQWLRQRNCIGMVLTVSDKRLGEYELDEEPLERVVGFVIYQLFKHKLELIQLRIHPDFRGRGFGTELLDKIKSKLSIQRRRVIQYWVGLERTQMLSWLKGQGFTTTGLCREDWVPMSYMHDTHIVCGNDAGELIDSLLE